MRPPKAVRATLSRALRRAKQRQCGAEFVFGLQCLRRGGRQLGARGWRGRAPSHQQALNPFDHRLHRRRALAGFAQRAAQRAHQSQRRFGTFQITPEPEQVVRRTARHPSRDTLDANGVARRQQRRCSDLFLRHDPDVGGPAHLRPSTRRGRQADRRCGRIRPAGWSSRSAWRPRTTRSTNGRGEIWPLSHTGVVERRTISCPT